MKARSVWLSSLSFLGVLTLSFQTPVIAATVYIETMTAARAAADGNGGGDDDTYIKINGNCESGEFKFRTGQSQTIGFYCQFDREALIRLYDKDGGSSRDDQLGAFTVNSRPTNGLRRVTVSGSGSEYDVYYRVD